MEFFNTPEGQLVRLLPVGFRGTFHTPYSDTHGYEGMSFEVTNRIIAPTPDYDLECLPMYEVTVTDGTYTFGGIMAYPEELTIDQTYHSHNYSGEYGHSAG